MLRATSKPPARLTVLKSDESRVGAYLQDNVQSPVTSVSAETLTSLHNLIKQDAHMLDEMNI